MVQRVAWMQESALWCDEAESSINALTILQTGVPGWQYLGIPVFENTLTEPWPEHPEYEFRDSTYSDRGVVVYHGWLPIYAIALAQKLAGMEPDLPRDPPEVLHGPGQVDFRTVIPRLPALVFSSFSLLLAFLVGKQLAGTPAGFAALILMAFNARTVDFGIQARYYSLTLLMNLLMAWLLWRMATRGQWRDFLFFGLGAALLFHTHLLSLLVFGGVTLAALPWIVRHPRWVTKALAGAGLSLLLILPWVVLSGFLETANSVPKVFKLFESSFDAIFYAVDRPLPLLFLAGVVGGLVLLAFRPQWLPWGLGDRLRRHWAIYVLLLLWMVLGYLMFHLLMPAASFFLERLTLVLWTPFVLALSLATTDLFMSIAPRRAGLLAVVAMLVFLVGRHRFAPFETTSIGGERDQIRAVLEALQARAYESGTRFYAIPNEHLTYTYYSGLPVQSVAPVRREFFLSYPKPVVFIEFQMGIIFPEPKWLQMVLEENGHPSALSKDWKHRVWTTLLIEELEARDLPLPERPELPPALEKLVGPSRQLQEYFWSEYWEGLQSSPVLRGIPARNMNDVWMGFFYRFVEPEKRIGLALNILPRLRTGTAEAVPDGRVVIFYSPKPVSIAP